MDATTAVHFDPYDNELARNPYPMYQRMRDEVPLYYNEEHEFYAVSRYADVQQVFMDPKTFSSARGGILEIIKMGMEMPSGVVIFEDPPSHTIHRKLLAKLFTPRAIAALEPQIRQFCAEALDPLVGEKSFDLVARLGAQMPMQAIGMLLGIPEDRQAELRDQANAAIGTDDGGAMTEDDLMFNTEALGEFVDWRYDNPSDDIMTELIQAEFTDNEGNVRTLTRDEVMIYCTVLAGAGNETTGRLIGWMGRVLGDNPQARHELAADPSLIPNAIEELLRYEPPGPFIARYVTQEVELVGEKLPAGSIVLGIMSSANRDERRYTDPNTFDIRRPDIEHLSFGQGIHFCIGNALARLEGRIAMEEILKRWPDWQVDDTKARLQVTSTVRGYATMPIIVG